MITINLIRQNGGVIAGQKKSVDIWIHGGIVTITDEAEIKLIESWIRTAANGQTGKPKQLIIMFLICWINTAFCNRGKKAHK